MVVLCGYEKLHADEGNSGACLPGSELALQRKAHGAAFQEGADVVGLGETEKGG